MLEIKLPWRTKLNTNENQKTEQEKLKPDKEPDTQLIDLQGAVNYYLYEENFTDLDELIRTYREMATNFEINEALDEIQNEAIVFDDAECVSLNLDKVNKSVLSESIKEKIQEEFINILNLLHWEFNAGKYFRNWFIDGRIYFQKVMNANPRNGIEEIIHLESLKIKRMKDKKTGDIWYQYDIKRDKNDNTYLIPKDGVTYVPSGLVDPTGSFYISELHRSIRPLNNLRLMEDSALIYYLTRAPQKRAFYIDGGSLSPSKGEEKLKKIMQKFTQRISYDSTTGKVLTQKRSIPVNEDYWLLTRGDTRGTKIETLQGDTNLLNIDVLNYYKKKLYKSLAVPFSRIDDENNSMVEFGNYGELSRQEVKFFKATQDRRRRFSNVFSDLLKTQIIAKKIIDVNDWKKIKNFIEYNWKNDSFFTMLKKMEVLEKQIDTANSIESFVGKYFSEDYVRKEIFNQSDKDIEIQNKQIENEKSEQQPDEEIPPDENVDDQEM